MRAWCRRAGRSGIFAAVFVIADAATSFTIALLITFLGIGVVANVLIAYAVAGVFGERRQNQELLDAPPEG